MPTKCIGIIGGAGVAATNKLCELIEIALTKKGAFRDCHHPEMIIYQATQAPSRSMFLENKGDSFIEDYINVAKKLERAGSKKIYMCCNTAHYAFDEIQQSINIPLYNLVEEAVIKAKKSGKKNIALIASDGCLLGKVYEKYFEKYFLQSNVIYPDINTQSEITKGICNIKNKSRFLSSSSLDRPKNIFNNITRRIFNAGADLIIIGCTDIRVDFKCKNTIDSLELMAESIIGDLK